MAKVLLAGATGNLGRHVLRQLGVHGHYVRALVRRETQAADLRGFAQEIVFADLTQADTLSACCHDIDTVISAAGASVDINTSSRQTFREIDFEGNRNLLEEAIRGQIRKFVYVSALTSTETAHTAYLRAKEDFAALVMKSGLDYQILRPTGFFSAFAFLAGMARERSLPLIGEGTAKTNPIDDEEVATACVEAIQSEIRELALGGPDILTRKEILDLVFHAIGREPRYQRIPAVVVKVAGAAMGLFNPRKRDLTEFYLAVGAHDCIAPPYGRRRLADYFGALNRSSIST
ncbi:MAG: SDR family oxidoreductase [Bryobacteraceae bacterium]